MSDWEITITKAENGFICTWYDDDEEGLPSCKKAVFQDKDTKDGELFSMQYMLYCIKEYFGVFYSKHNKKNLVIQIEESGD